MAFFGLGGIFEPFHFGGNNEKRGSGGSDGSARVPRRLLLEPLK